MPSAARPVDGRSCGECLSRQALNLFAVIVYLLCSYYPPPIWGWVSLRWLTHHDYL
jgi:hypothetical protein